MIGRWTSFWKLPSRQSVLWLKHRLSGHQHRYLRRTNRQHLSTALRTGIGSQRRQHVAIVANFTRNSATIAQRKIRYAFSAQSQVTMLQCANNDGHNSRLIVSIQTSARRGLRTVRGQRKSRSRRKYTKVNQVHCSQYTQKFSSGKKPQVQFYSLKYTRQYRAKPTTGELPGVEAPEVDQA